jgi:prepilin-type N-terminal cleavage/methylation domain-containing protein
MAAAQPMIRPRSKGFTLVELLISITILSLVIGLASYAFSLFSRHFETPRRGFQGAVAELQRLDLVVRALGDAIPWAVKTDGNRFGLYFLGREEGLTLVSASPVFSTGAPAVIRVFREPAGNNRWRLVYEEASLATVMLQAANQELPFSKRMIVATNLPSLRFSYFGWSSADARAIAADSGLQAEWSAEFDGLVRLQQPLRVSMELGSFVSVLSLPERTDALLGRVAPDE